MSRWLWATPGALSLACWLLMASLLAEGARAQASEAGIDVSFRDYDPPSTLVVPEQPVTRARFPFIDVHNHQWQMPDQDLSEVVGEMDVLNMGVMVNLSGRGFRRVVGEDGKARFGINGGEFLERAVANARTNAPGRFIVFTNIDVAEIDDPLWTSRTVAQLEEDVRHGAKGLKIYKDLGLEARDSRGRRIRADDERLDAVWAKCGELGIPVLIHTGEPATFWLPINEHNERLYEMLEKPGRHRGDASTYPSWETVMAEQHRVFRKHRNTKFINAHLGWMGNDLARLGRLLDEMPNVYTEIGAVLAELGRQPRFARQWFIRYQDRVMFGKDTWAPEEYHVYFRTLETDDDYFDYYRRRHAFWKIYGLDLPDEVLKKLYYKNALGVIPGIDASHFPD